MHALQTQTNPRKCLRASGWTQLLYNVLGTESRYIVVHLQGEKRHLKAAISSEDVPFWRNITINTFSLLQSGQTIQAFGSIHVYVWRDEF